MHNPGGAKRNPGEAADEAYRLSRAALRLSAVMHNTAGALNLSREK